MGFHAVFKRGWIGIAAVCLLAACANPSSTPTRVNTAQPPQASATAPHPAPLTTTPSLSNPTTPPQPTDTPAPGSAVRSTPALPVFSHVIVFMFENKDYKNVIGSPLMPAFNNWASQYTLLSAYYAVAHPSLPNYLAFIGGDTFGISNDCNDCFINSPSLPDEIEASERTWRTYQEDMPSPCFLGNTKTYAQKHNPFLYFDPIRTNAARCKQGVVPLDQLPADLAAGTLPNYAFIMPNLCHSSHDCALDITDAWLKEWVGRVLSSSAYDDHTLIVLTWDEGSGIGGCCGLKRAGGRVATVLISPLVQLGYQDPTPYTHYSLLKTIAAGWGMAPLGHAADESNVLIRAPFGLP